MKPLLIGLAPNHPGEPGAFTVPGGSGRRLAALLHIDQADLLTVVDAVNLSPEPVSSLGVRAWQDLAGRLDFTSCVVVACGRIVAAAVGAPFQMGEWVMLADTALTSIPHPSGRCRAWNDPEIVAKGERTLAEAVWLAGQYDEVLIRG